MNALSSMAAIAATVTLLCLTPANAQRGMGDSVGLARQGVHPIVVTFSGTLGEIHVGPCEHTTGQAQVGTHLMIDTADGGRLNVHLGPAAEVESHVSRLVLGEPITVDAFETAELPDGHRIAQKITQAGTTFVLRDDDLRPVWASGPAARYLKPRVCVEQKNRATSTYRDPYRYSARYGYQEGYPAGYGYGWRSSYRYAPSYYDGPRGRGRYYRRR